MSNSQLYSGDLSPEEAFSMLAADTSSVLVDVRTATERHYVGYPQVARYLAAPIFLEPDMSFNNKFVQQIIATCGADQKLLFICHLGGRSRTAAQIMFEHGYVAYNVLEGFVGDKNASGIRGQSNGWQGRNLPWRQE